MSTKKIVYIIVAAVIVAFIVLKLVMNKHTINKRAETAIQQQVFTVIPVKTIYLEKAGISHQFTQSGTFSAQQDLKLTAQSQGQIKKLYVKKTQFVLKGTLLATIDNSALSSQISTSKAALEQAQEDAQRTKNAHASGGVTQQQVENADLQVKSAQSSLSQLQQQSANYRVIAPVSGVINDIYAEEESFVAPGTPILEIVDITKVNLNVGINQEMLPELKMGQHVKVTTDVYPKIVFDGMIENVNVKADASQKIEIGITIQNTKEHPILVGMFGKAEFVYKANATNPLFLFIPRDAIIGSIQDAKVFVVKSDNTVTLRTITVGKSIENAVEVISGLKVGEQVVTAGQINLEEGKKVIVKN